MGSVVGLEVSSSNNHTQSKSQLPSFANQAALTEASTISSLRTYLYRVDEWDLVGNVEKTLRAEPNLPGVIVTSQSDVRGVISRSKFFELMGTRYGVAVFYKRPLQVMLKQVAPPTILSDCCTIHEAVRTALNRPSDLIYEPILVDYKTGQYRLLDIYTLLLAQSHLFAQLQQELQQINQDLEGRVERRTAALQKANEQLNEEISERKVAEENLQVRFRYERALSRSADTLLTALDNPHVIPETLEYLLEATGVSRVFLGVNVYDEELGNCLQLQHQAFSIDAQPIPEAFYLFPHDYLAEWLAVLRKGKSLVAHFDEVEGKARQLLAVLNIKSVLLLPMGRSDNWLGVVALDETAVKRIWNEDDIQLMQTVARMLAAYIERQQSRADLAKARDAALAASQFKSELVAKVSHELRTPLGAIKGYAQLLQLGSYGLLQTNQKEPLELIISSTNYLTLLVNELLDQAKLESNKLVLQITPFDPRQMLREVEARMRILAETKGLQFHSWIDPAFPEELTGDITRLQQILTNLLGNAIKFTERGSVQTKLEMLNTEQWSMQVSDTGPGIPTEAIPTIFEPFGQVDGSTTREHSGTGLGLSISKQLVELMGGKLKLESEPEHGSVFTVCLPLVHT